MDTSAPAHPIALQRQLLAKEHHFMSIVHDYLGKSTLPYPRKLTKEIVAVNLGLIESMMFILEMEMKRLHLPDSAFILDPEWINEGAEKRLRELLAD